MARNSHFLEIITESNDRHWFPVQDIQHMKTEGKTVCVFSKLPERGFICENVSNIDDLVKQMSNVDDYYSE